MTRDTTPITVAIANDYEIVVRGAAALLAPWSQRVRVVELDSGLPVVSDVDVILYDSFGQVDGEGVGLADLLEGARARVVVFSWNVQPALVEAAIARGAAGYVSKAVPGSELVSAIEQVHAGHTVVPAVSGVNGAEPSGQWPGRKHGLTAREAEVLSLIVQGLSNQEIADRTYLSINSVKTYVRTAYRKLGVTRRSQAVAWGMRSGFSPDRVRTLDAGVDPRTGVPLHPFGRTAAASEPTR